ncbi:hypothetical protein U27_00355 [Candidatus Vecturithrix granuli]|uniref:Uncharacterized protein n=1 Tax=Vecturithrix granuli TaxID=1499967 RepID=A0A081C7A3_VECG1|nr:hypothetical protein U27_00355 [Candidatus Vecturithrix granuli]
MSNLYILNASPLICLGKAKLLEMISPLASAWMLP